MNDDKSIYISFLEFLLWFVGITSVISVATLILGVFKPKLILVGTAVILSAFYYFKDIKLDFHINKKSLASLLVLIFIALLFRIDFEQYIMGGQDEGVYVNMSKYFEKHGQVFPVDEFRKSLDGKLLTIYDKYNLRIEPRPNVRVEDKKEGLYLPGVYLKDQEKSEYVFQFYHLHPLWMSIFGDTFGDDHRQLSLVFFSILSIIIFYLIVYNLTNNYFYSLSGGLLLALNPLHTYFTKFPVSEVMVLFFSLSGFYYLILYYKNITENYQKINRYLFLSVLLISCLFFTHIRGFMYMPFFYSLLAIIIIKDRDAKKELIFYTIAVISVYTLSVFYGYAYSYPYVTDIYRTSFSRLFGTNWDIYIIIILLIMVNVLFLISYFSKLRKLCENVLNICVKYSHIFFFIVFVLSLFKIYQLGFTDKYIGNGWLDDRWGIAATGLKAVFHSSIVVFTEHISPFLITIFLIALLKYNRKNLYLNFLLLFIFGFWVYALILQNVVPYQYYYARYLLSELIPYVILFTVLFLAAFKNQKIAKVFIVLSVIYFALLTSMQLRGTESKGAYKSFNRISQEVGSEDLLLVNSINRPFEFKTTLKYYYDLNVFSFNKDQLDLTISLYRKKHNGNIYVLSPFQYNSNYLDLVKNINVRIESSNYDRSNLPVVTYYTHVKYYNLYKLNNQKYKRHRIEAEGIIFGDKNNFQDNTWTKKTSYINNINLVLKNHRKFLQLETYGYNPKRADIEWLDLKLKINEAEAEFEKYDNKSYYFRIPDSVDVINEIEISSNTFVPKELGMNNDTRELGIDVKSIKLIEELPQ